MTARRVRGPALVGVTRWAVAGNGQLGPGAYFGINPDNGTVVRVDGDNTRDRMLVSATVPRGVSLAVSWDTTVDPLDPEVHVWVSGGGTLTQLAGWDLAVVNQWADRDFDGSPLWVTRAGGTAVIQAGRSGGRLSRMTTNGADLVLQSDSYFAAEMAAVAAVSGVLHILTVDAELITVSYDPVRAAYRRQSSLLLPQVHGLRDLTAVVGDGVLSLVGTDRKGDGAVVRVECGTQPPTLLGVSRTYAASIVLTALDIGRVGTTLAQDPTTLPEVPWHGRTDALRGSLVDDLLLVARPAYGEVWVAGVGGNPEPSPGDVLLFEVDGSGWLLLEDGDPLLLES